MSEIRDRVPNQALGRFDPRQTQRQASTEFGPAFVTDGQGRVQLKPLGRMPNSSAGSLEQLRQEHNALLAALRAAGWMEG